MKKTIRAREEAQFTVSVQPVNQQNDGVMMNPVQEEVQVPMQQQPQGQDQVLMAVKDLQESVDNMNKRVDVIEQQNMQLQQPLMQQPLMQQQPLNNMPVDEEQMLQPEANLEDNQKLIQQLQADNKKLQQDNLKLQQQLQQPEEEDDDDDDDDNEENKFKEDLTGVPERPLGKKSEKPMGNDPKSIPDGGKQLGTGKAPGDENNDVDKYKQGDDLGAAAKVPKPSPDYSKPSITKNQLNVKDEGEEAPENPEEMDMKYKDNPVIKELYKLKRTLMREDFSALTKRQSLAGGEGRVTEKANMNLKNKEYINVKSSATQVVKEYLSKPGVISNSLKRNFGL